MRRKRYRRLVLWGFVPYIIFMLFSCKTADINVLGIKTFTFESEAENDATGPVTTEVEKSNGIFTVDGNGKGMIKGELYSSDSSLIKYALVSFTLKNEDYSRERWINFYSDKYGRFQINNLPDGNYKILTAQVNAYQTIQDNVVISPENFRIYLKMEIKPIE